MKLIDDSRFSINLIRKKLYQLHAENLVYFKRSKDDEYNAYCFFWVINNYNYKLFLQKKIKQKIIKLEKLNNNKMFYACCDDCFRMSFEDALEFNFVCPECGQVLNVCQSNISIDLNEELNKLYEELDFVNSIFLKNHKISVNRKKAKSEVPIIISA